MNINRYQSPQVILPALYEALDEVYDAGLEGRVFMGGEGRHPRALVGYYIRSTNASLRERVVQRLGEWQDAYLHAYRPGTEMGDWLQVKLQCEV
jgi:hypothetical protein